MIETERLYLRAWRDGDREPFHAMGNDPRVMEFLGDPQTPEQVDAAMARQNDAIARLGHGFWALEQKSNGAFMGFCGIKIGPDGTPIANQIEIGWRLAHAFWGKGFAREAAEASLDWGWANLDVPEIAAITTVKNYRSRTLMERLGMTYSPDGDFDHPGVPSESPILRHVTYRILRPAR
jgi:RimJ/RimL family protein N-acetyltransferase